MTESRKELVLSLLEKARDIEWTGVDSEGAIARLLRAAAQAIESESETPLGSRDEVIEECAAKAKSHD
jgi:hypothetical protein